MFAPRYFAPRYFTPRYFPPGIERVVEEELVYYGGGRKRYVSRDFVKKLWEVQELRLRKAKRSKQTELPLEVPVAKGIALPAPQTAATTGGQRRPVPGHVPVDIEAMIAKQRMSLRERAGEHAEKLAAARMIKLREQEEEEQVLLLAAMIAEDDF